MKQVFVSIGCHLVPCSTLDSSKYELSVNNLLSSIKYPPSG